MKTISRYTGIANKSDEPHYNPTKLMAELHYPSNIIFIAAISLITILKKKKLRLSAYSVRKLFTGLARAAFIDSKLTVTAAINNTKIPAAVNIHQEISIR